MNMEATLKWVVMLRHAKHVATKMRKQQMGSDKTMILSIVDIWSNIKKGIAS